MELFQPWHLILIILIAVIPMAIIAGIVLSIVRISDRRRRARFQTPPLN